MTMPRKNAANTRRGRPFAPGNPGKPKGARHRTTMAVEVLLDNDAERLTRKAVELALEGDVTALRLCLDRIAPAPKGRRIALDLPRVETAGDVAKALDALMIALGSGEITTDEAATIAGVIETRRRVVELVEIERRIALLEKGQADGQSNRSTNSQA